MLFVASMVKMIQNRGRGGWGHDRVVLPFQCLPMHFLIYNVQCFTCLVVFERIFRGAYMIYKKRGIGIEYVCK